MRTIPTRPVPNTLKENPKSIESTALDSLYLDSSFQELNPKAGVSDRREECTLEFHDVLERAGEGDREAQDSDIGRAKIGDGVIRAER